jgi:LmbE family N-acetylglucosaminyl deacetylase
MVPATGPPCATGYGPAVSAPGSAVSEPESLGTILAIFAHPDDETYLCGGLMAAAVAAGSRVACVTATRGELGSTDPVQWPPGEGLATLRTAELAASLTELGVSEHTWLDYADGGLTGVDRDEAVGRLLRIAGDVSPDTILSFGPDGGTGHPDHITVSEWATAVAAECGARVHYSTNTPEWMARFAPALEPLGVYLGNEPPPGTPVERLSINYTCEGTVLESKVQAILRQESQVAPLRDALGVEFMYAGLAEEAFWSPS